MARETVTLTMANRVFHVNDRRHYSLPVTKHLISSVRLPYNTCTQEKLCYKKRDLNKRGIWPNLKKNITENLNPIYEFAGRTLISICDAIQSIYRHILFEIVCVPNMNVLIIEPWNALKQYTTLTAYRHYIFINMNMSRLVKIGYYFTSLRTTNMYS